MFAQMNSTARLILSSTSAVGAAAGMMYGIGGGTNSNLDVAHAASQEVSPQPSTSTSRREELRAALETVRRNEKEINERWERDEVEKFRNLPSRAWPEYQPGVLDVPKITANLKNAGCLDSSKGCPKRPDEQIIVCKSPECERSSFDLAVALLFNNLDCERGLRIFSRLADRGHVDGMVATGIVLVEGLGVEPNEKEGIKWLRAAVKRGSAQAYYELGSAAYSGIDG